MDARVTAIPPESPSNDPPSTVLGGSGWRSARGEPSLAGMFATVRTAKDGSFWRKLLAFLGPGYLVAVGYMDPGNWATALAGGSQFGYALLWVALLSNLMAIVLQSLCARLAIATGRDLAQVIGTAIGLNLIFGIPLEIGILITGADVFLILYLQNKGFRKIEAFII